MMLYFLEMFLFIILLSFSISVILEKELKYTIPFSFFCIILWMYIGGLFLDLRIVFALLLVCYVGIVCYSIYKIKGKWKEKIKQYLYDPILLLYFLLFLIIIAFNFDKHISYIDEYRHWGTVVKAMWESHQLSFHMDYIMYPSYLPAISLLQYTFMSLCGFFSENILYITFYLFGASLILPFLKVTRKNLFFFLILAFFLPTVLFTSYYNCIYVDGLIGVLFCFSMLLIMKKVGKNASKFDLALLTLSLIALTLLKNTGFYFALVALLYWGVTVKVRKTGQWKSFFLLATVIILARFSWNVCLALFNTPLQHQNPMPLKELWDLITFQWNDLQNGVISQFVRSFFQLKIVTDPISLDYISIMILFVLGAYWIYQKSKKADRKDLKYFNCFMLGGALLYPIALLLMYLFQFEPYDAIRLSSYDRYIVIFINAVLIAWMLLIFERFEKPKDYIIGICIFCLFVPYAQVLNWFDQRDTNFEEEWGQIGMFAKEHDVLIYDPTLLEVEYSKIRYYMNVTSKENFDHITITSTFDENNIDIYDYIYLKRVPDSLEGKVEKDKIYQVRDDGSLKLIYSIGQV